LKALTVSLGSFFLALLCGCHLDDSRTAWVTGEFVDAEVGSAYYLTIRADGAYIIRAAESMPPRRIAPSPYREIGVWRWEGPAIILLPHPPYSAHPFFQSMRKLFPLVTVLKRTVLVPAMNRDIGPIFEVVFIKYDEPARDPNDSFVWPPRPPGAAGR
jgi:hypothetical protein